jgi:hypothetical protein
MRAGKRAKKSDDLVADLRNKQPCDETDITLLKKCVGSWLMYSMVQKNPNTDFILKAT